MGGISMKKVLALVVFAVICLNLVACTGTVNSENGAYVNQQGGQQVSAKQIKVGDKIVTDSMEVVINRVELTYDVLPDNASGVYSHYVAEEGKVYICVDADVTNKAKQKLACDEIGTIAANYNDGYTYNGFTAVEDSSTGFTYANITSIDPLETRGIKWLVNCPQEVETSNNSLILELAIGGDKFVYTVR